MVDSELFEHDFTLVCRICDRWPIDSRAQAEDSGWTEILKEEWPDDVHWTYIGLCPECESDGGASCRDHVINVEAKGR